ncbi:MAG: adenylate/guanylate cyclase domain-containing protein [Candidatus Limnocylindrales bacterium]
MARIQAHHLDDPHETISFPHGMNQVVRLGELVVGRDVHEPGWHWAEHVRPIVGTEWCEFTHRGIVASGQMGVRMNDGEELVIGPNTVFDIPPGHDGWVVGDEPLVTLDWAGVEGWASPPVEGERIVTTILFTDIVDSTVRARQLGDLAWKRTMGHHDEQVRSVLAVFRGREVKMTGDGFLAVFDGAARAVRCGEALVRTLATIDLPVRVGIHSGEVELEGADLRGIAVHVAARVMSLAGPGEVLVSGTTRELAEGSGLRLRSRGRYPMKGLKGEREVFALESE